MPTDELELEALRIGVNFVRLNGNVALIASGAGLNMNAMDNIKSTGLEAANFLDTGGGITSKMMIDSMKLVEKLPDVKAILFSIYGGVNPLVEMAKGVVAGKAELTRDIIVVVKAMGNYQDECWDILEDNNIKAIKNHRIEDALAYIKEQLEGLSI
jgi:succinyl-CoA synthetase beta subunit